ncbi:NUDIX hydrolase [Sphingobacteriaceae bacterium]|nr:NUDIX hydrolase [Sphingobacteriaceae bacterium]
MNTRIYLNDKFLEFVSLGTQPSQDQSIKLDESEESEKKLKQIIENFTDETQKNSVFISGLAFEKAFPILKKSLHYIEAAGGFIEKNNEFLFIRRHNRWDLPKGKLEKGETIEEAAVRECEEECAIKNLTLKKQLPSSFHIYQYKKGYAIKQSYWFYMTTDYSEKLIPQAEESITEVRWCSREEIESSILKDTYYTISDVTREGLKK